MGKGGLQKCSNVLKNVVLAERENVLVKKQGLMCCLRRRYAPCSPPKGRVGSESFAGNDIDHPAGQVRAKGGFSAPSWEKEPLHDRK